MATYAQYLLICGIDLVLLLLLLTFRDILLSYLLVLIRTITATGIPVRRNIKVMKKLLTKELKYNKIKPSKLSYASTILIAKKLHVDPENLRFYVNY